MYKQFLVDLGSNSAGVLENALPMVTGAVAEPVAGLAALYHAATGGHDASGVVSAIRDAMTYQPRTDAGKMYQRELGSAVSRIAQSAPVRTWRQGVDIAGQYSPTAGAVLQTVPAAIGVAAGAGPSLRTGRAVSGALNRAESFAPSRSGSIGGGGQVGAINLGDIYQVSPTQLKAYELGKKHAKQMADNPDISKHEFYWQLPHDELELVGDFSLVPARSAYYESGLRGAKMPEPRYGYRWGSPPASGLSTNHIEQRLEHGVSMANVEGVDYQWAKMSSGKDPRKYQKYTGMLLDPEYFWGSDGEPLMVRVRKAED